jgi:steroid delta-isomerase-like uncharacterized protein
VSKSNADVVRRFVEEYQSGAHDVAVAQEILGDDFVDHSPVAGLPSDRDSVLALFEMFFTAFADFNAVIHRQVSEGAFVTTHKTFHGTHRGPFMGIEPTGTAVAFDVIDILLVADGRMREHWNVVDTLGLLQQLGAAPSPG